MNAGARNPHERGARAGSPARGGAVAARGPGDRRVLPRLRPLPGVAAGDHRRLDLDHRDRRRRRVGGAGHRRRDVGDGVGSQPHPRAQRRLLQRRPPAPGATPGHQRGGLVRGRPRRVCAPRSARIAAPAPTRWPITSRAGAPDSMVWAMWSSARSRTVPATSPSRSPGTRSRSSPPASGPSTGGAGACPISRVGVRQRRDVLAMRVTRRSGRRPCPRPGCPGRHRDGPGPADHDRDRRRLRRDDARAAGRERVPDRGRPRRPGLAGPAARGSGRQPGGLPLRLLPHPRPERGRERLPGGHHPDRLPRARTCRATCPPAGPDAVTCTAQADLDFAHTPVSLLWFWTVHLSVTAAGVSARVPPVPPLPGRGRRRHPSPGPPPHREPSRADPAPTGATGSGARSW